MKSKFINIIFISLLAVVINVSAKERQKDVLTQSFKAIEGGKLVVNVNQGDIQIKTWDKNEVLVKVDGIDDDDIETLKFQESNGTITVSQGGHWGWSSNAEYSFTIPTKFSMEIQTSGGDIEIKDNIKGNVDLRTAGGDIDIQSVYGDLELATSGGDISLIDATGRTNISTQGGDIMAQSLSGSVQSVKTMGGDISIHLLNNVKEVVTYGGDIDIDECKGDIEVATFGGDIEIRKATGSVKAKTYGGDVYVTGANGFVEVNTGGGDIELKDITGAVEAKTGAGYIYIELNPAGERNSEIKTSAGDITLVLSGKAGASISAKVNGYGGRNNEESQIESDFAGEISQKRSKATGLFKINGGGPSIEVEAFNGTISLKKSK